MTKYSCEKCKKEFTKKSHYESHIKRKTPCEINTVTKIKTHVYKTVEKKLKELFSDKLFDDKINKTIDEVVEEELKELFNEKLNLIKNKKIKVLDLFCGLVE